MSRPKRKLYQDANAKRAMTCGEIAELMGDITEAGVIKAEQSALAKLRHNPKAKRLLELYKLKAQSRRSNNLGTLTEDEVHSGEWLYE